ncbi:MAG: flagellar hook basal-body protein [Armatimonadetes bacterium]|nr:flagellar hook basal-body protein [Armatimonadota bacterium]MDW8027449.1 flagellar hook basal-body protein [Armatimonadota bacterium]
MSIGIYNTASAMMMRMGEIDIIAHNLANAETPGYKTQKLSFRNFGETFLWSILGSINRTPARLPLGVTVNAQRLNLQTGSMRPTSNPLDVAIDGDGWFVVQTPQGIRYTRKGNFALSRDGTLVTSEGFAVLGDNNQPVRIPTNAVSSVRISETGEIFIGNQRLGRLQVVTIQSVRPAGEGYYTGVNPRPANARIAQGMLESSNVQVVTELVRMLNALRSYEAAARTFSAFETSKQALLEATRV